MQCQDQALSLDLSFRRSSYFTKSDDLHYQTSSGTSASLNRVSAVDSCASCFIMHSHCLHRHNGFMEKHTKQSGLLHSEVSA